MTPAIFGIAGHELSADERAFFRDADPAGYILFGRNVASRAQVRALTDELRAIHGRDRLIVAIDQEGGRVARMKPPEWLAYPSGEVFDRLYDIAPISAIEAARVNAEALAIDLAEVGVSVDHYPSLDVRQPGAHDVIGDRAFGSEPMRVAALGRAVLDGLARGGILGTIKHMPGHGRAMADSHKEMPTVEASDAELESDIAPFRALADYPIGMTGHIRFTAWDDENPHAVSDFAALQHGRGRTQVFNATVRARAKEDRVDLDVAQLRARPQPHVLKRSLNRNPLDVVGDARWVGHACAQRRALTGIGSPGDERREL